MPGVLATLFVLPGFHREVFTYPAGLWHVFRGVSVCLNFVSRVTTDCWAAFHVLLTQPFKKCMLTSIAHFKLCSLLLNLSSLFVVSMPMFLYDEHTGKTHNRKGPPLASLCKEQY